MALEACLCARLRRLLLRLLRRDLGELPMNLAAAFRVPLLALGQPEVLELALVMALLERGAGRPQLDEPFIVLGERALELGQLLALLLDLLLAIARLMLQALDFPLSSETAGVAGVGGVEAHAKAAGMIALTIYQNHVPPQRHSRKETPNALY